MASYFYAPGAIEHYVTLRNGTSYYLGTAVTAPEVEGRPFYLNVINDIGGRSAPMDKVGDRAQHLVTTTLNRFDETVLQIITGLNTSTGLAAHTTLNQGTLTFGYLDFQLVLVYAASVAGLTPSIFPVGRRYYQSQVVGLRESTVGTRVQEVTLAIECNEIFVPATRVFNFYTENSSLVTTGLPDPT